MARLGRAIPNRARLSNQAIILYLGRFTTANAQVAIGTGTANDVGVASTIGAASSTATAQAPSAVLTVNAGSASATGTAHNASGPTSLTTVFPSVASGTGTVNGATVLSSSTAFPGVARGTGRAFGTQRPTFRRIVYRAHPGFRADIERVPFAVARPSAASASGVANDPSLVFVIVRTAVAGLATGTGTSTNPTAITDRPVGRATASGAANGATVAVTASAGRAQGSGTAQSATAVPVENDPLRRYRTAAVAGSAKALLIADSLGEGVGTGSTVTNSTNFVDEGYWPVLLRLQQARYHSGGVGLVNTYSQCRTTPLAGSGSGSVYWTSTGGGSSSLTDTHAFGKRSYLPAVNEVITLHCAASTSVSFQYAQGSGIGSFTVAPDGVNAVTVTPSTSGSVTYQGTYQTPVLAHGAHTYVLTPAAGTALPVRTVLVHDGDDATGLWWYNHSHGGFQSAQFVATNGPGTVAGLTDAMSAGLCADPALVVIELGINDHIVFPPIDPATFQTNLQTIIANVKSLCSTTPSFLIVVAYETNDPLGAASNPWSDYVTAMYAVAAADPANVGIIDFSTRMAKPTAGNSFDSGKVNTDGIHPTTAGHAYIASEIDAILN